MRFIKTIIVSCLLIIAPVVYADAVTQLKTFSANTKSATGTFTQAMVVPGQTTRFTNKASGQFAFLRPGKFIWTYTKPYKQVIQSDGKQFFMYDKDLNQVTIKKLGDTLGSSPAAILFGTSRIEDHFTLKNAGSHNGCDWVSVTPKKQDTPFEKIVIGFQNDTIAAMELHDALGHLTLIKFTRFEKNAPLTNKSFKFSVPKGADVYKN